VSNLFPCPSSSIFFSMSVEPFPFIIARIMCEDTHDSSAIPNHASSGLRLQITKGFKA
jgi:hypothetical protein